MTMPSPRHSFSVGETATRKRTVTASDIEAFAKLTRDFNPIHTDPDYAKTTRFGQCIAHGMLTASLVSSVLGVELPGPGAIYMNQELRFEAAVMAGDRIEALVEVTDWDEKKGRIRLATQVRNQHGTVVLSGEARLVLESCLR